MGGTSRNGGRSFWLLIPTTQISRSILADTRGDAIGDQNGCQVVFCRSKAEVQQKFPLTEMRQAASAQSSHSNCRKCHTAKGGSRPQAVLRLAHGMQQLEELKRTLTVPRQLLLLCALANFNDLPNRSMRVENSLERRARNLYIISGVIIVYLLAGADLENLTLLGIRSPARYPVVF